MSKIFPTLSRGPEASDWSEETSSENMMISSEYEDGSVHTRARFTSIPKKWPEISYILLSQTDKDLLTAFEIDVNFCSDSFIWINPQDSQRYTVRFITPIKYKVSGRPDRWSATFGLIESFPHSNQNIMVETIIATNPNVTSSEITLVGQILSSGDQVNQSDLIFYFEYGSDITHLYPTDFSDMVNVSDFKMGTKNPSFALSSDILTHKDLYYRAVVKSENGSDIGYGQLKLLSSDLMGY
jgi:hypothetical protein